MMKHVEWIGALLASGLVAWWWALHPQHLLVGVTQQSALVPWWYQACAFPPFFMLLPLLLRPGLRRGAAVLLVGCSALAVVRLAGLIPLSGHGVFLAAALVFSVSTRQPWWLTVSTAAGLLLTSWYKVQWGDVAYFALSCALGATWAMLARRFNRHRLVDND